MAATASSQAACSSSSETQIHDIPDECLALVLRFLGLSFRGTLPVARRPYAPVRIEHPLQCALVCKHWRTLADAAVRALQLHALDDSSTAQITRRFTRLASIQLSRDFPRVDLFRALADGTPALDSLQLHCDFCHRALLSIPRWTSLTRLKLSQSIPMTSSEEAEATIDALRSLPSLQHLTFGFRKWFRNTLDPARLFARAEALTALLTLRLTCTPALPPPSSTLFPRVLRKLVLQYFDGGPQALESLGRLTGLVALTIGDTWGLQEMVLPESLGQLSGLTKLQMLCPQATWPQTTSNLQALRVLKIEGAPPEELRHLTGLEHLSVRGRDLDWQMEDLRNLPALCSLRTLQLRGCHKISEIPDGIGRLLHLEVLKLLDLSSLAVVPSTLGLLTSLTELSLGGCAGLRALPERLGGLANLRGFQIRRLPLLSRLPRDIFGGWRALAKLEVSACPLLTELPEGFGRLGALQELRIADCRSLASLPQSLGALRDLRVVRLQSCGRLAVMPEGLAQLSALEELKICDCDGLVSLPASLSALTRLRALSVMRCGRLKRLPEVSALEELLVSECPALVSLPPSLGSLPSLWFLSVSACNRLKGLTGTIKGLRALRELDLSGSCSLTAALRGLGACMGLRGLRLSRFERFSRLPEGVAALANLEMLEVSECASLVSLPRNLGAMARLRVLRVSDCPRLSGLPESARELSALRRLEVICCRGVASLPESVLCLLLQTGLTVDICTSRAHRAG